MSIRSRVLAFIRRHGLISENDRILVGVSGGPDSVALLCLLDELRDDLQFHFEAAHLEHGIRGDESREDARFVAGLADRLNVPFHLKEIDLPKIKGSTGRGNVEALARAERHRFFSEIVERRRLDKVALAHTQDDQVETALMWFLRGAGLKGLGGMLPRQELKLSHSEALPRLAVVRPLLETSKTDLLLFLQERGLAFRSDPTNLDTAYLRNWIRLELLPSLSRRTGRQLAARLARQAEICRDEDAVLDELARRRHEMIVVDDAASRQAFLEQPRALQRRILRFWIERKRGHLRALGFVHIEQILRLILDGPPQGRAPIPGGWEFRREYDTLRIVRRFRSGRGVCYSYRLEIGKPLAILEAGLELRSSWMPAAQARAMPHSLMEAVFDAASVTEPLTVRNFHRGDRFHPLGMAGHKKIKDLFIEKRVPLAIRGRWPLVTSGDEILWVPGYGRGSGALVSEETQGVLRLQAQPLEGSPNAPEYCYK